MKDKKESRKNFLKLLGAGALALPLLPLGSSALYLRKEDGSNINFNDIGLLDNGTTTGQLPFWDGTKWTYTETSELFWDDVNKRVGIGTATPSQQLELTQSIGLVATSSSTTGVIYKGGNRFIHNFKHPDRNGNNLFIGTNAGNFTMGTGGTIGVQSSGNLGFGDNALAKVTLGYRNIAIGANALFNTTTGRYNIAIGNGALTANETSHYNTAIGYNALKSSTVGNNTAIGADALFNTTTGQNNFALGVDSLFSNLTGFNNMALGNTSGYSLTSGYSNIFIGYQSGYRQTTNSNLLIIDNQQRADTATEASNSILYGVMATLPANQDLYINADTFLKADNRKLFFGAGDDASIYYDGTNLNIDTDLVGASDLTIDCGTDKTVVLEESVWDDIQFNIETGRTSAANFPDWDATFTTNTGCYKFDINDFIDLGTNEMSHDWKEATSIYPHIHTALDGANASGGTQYAKFIIYIAYAKDGVAYVETNKEIEVTIPDGTADLTHIFGQATALAMTGLTIGTQMNVRLKRIAATTGTEYPNHIFVTQVGIHYEIDTIGSRQIAIK